jgi:hypothetical protein
MWSGSLGLIPTGWQLCDGTNGTPDLRGYFVVGYSGSGDYATIGNTGGATTIGGNHTHTVTTAVVCYDVGTQTSIDVVIDVGDEDPDMSALENRPPYYVIAFIMKL